MVTKMLIEDVSRLLMMLKDCCRSAVRCCVVVCVSRFPFPFPFPLPLSLSNCVPVAAAMVFRLHLEGRTSW